MGKTTLDVIPENREVVNWIKLAGDRFLCRDLALAILNIRTQAPDSALLQKQLNYEIGIFK
jgi:hypothetical protein